MFGKKFSHYFTMLSAVVLGLATVAAVPTSEGESKALQYLLQRWLGFPEVQLIPGQLPKQLPVNLPLPEKAKIVGSIAHSAESFEIILDVVQSPEQAKTFYEQQLIKSGWQIEKQEDSSNQKSGFVLSNSILDDNSTNEDMTYCSISHKAILSVEPANKFFSTTEIRPEVRLKLELSPSTSSSEFQCSVSKSIEKVQLPALVSPSDVEISGVFGTNLKTSADSYAVLNTKLDAQALMNNYAAQVEKFGWKRQDSKQNKTGIWNTWTFKDNQGQPKQGMLSITQLAGRKNEYVAYIEYH